LVRLKHNEEFKWGGGARQREAFERIKEYLSTPLVLKAPQIGKAVRLYVAAQEHVVGAVSMQDDGGKGHPVGTSSLRNFCLLYTTHVLNSSIIFCLVYAR
jgi:hypothetical protein